MTATSLDLSQIRTDALSAASTFRSLIGLGTLATQSPTGTPSASNFLRGDFSWQTIDLTGYVPYTGATANLDLGSYTLSAKNATIAGGTVTTSTPVLNLTQTFNSAAVTFSALKLDVTDTASASGSLLLDLQVGGTSKFKVGKAGGITATTATLSATLDLTIRTVTYGATMAIDAALGNKIAITLTGNGTISNPSNSVDGRVLVFRLRQDGSGNRVPVWDTKYSFVGDLATVTLSTGANKIDRVAFEYDSTDDKWYCISFIKGS